MNLNKLKSFFNKPYIYLICSLFYLEILILINIFHSITLSFFYSILFDISFSLMIYFFIGLFKESISKWIYGLYLSLISLYFCTQILYYDFFKVFLTVYSIGNGGQVAEFYKDILQLIVNNMIWILFCFIPLFVYIIFVRKYLDFSKTSRYHKIIVCLSSFVFFLLGYSLLYLPSHSLNQPLDIYKESSINEMTVKQFGLMTAFRLDMQSLIFGHSDSDEEIEIEEPQILTYNPQVMNIDFDKMIEDAPNDTIKQMHQYFKNVTPTQKNEYTGMFKDYNVILITAEGFSPYAIREDITPTLYRMYQQGFQFKNFYTPLWNVSTSDGEYVAMQGLIPKNGTWSFRDSSDNDLPFTLGKQFQKLNYKTLAYHNHSYTYYGRNKSHPNLGYQFKAVGHGLNMKKQWPESDLEMMQKTVKEYINEEHFHAYYMTVSGHTNYTTTGNMMAYKNIKQTKQLDYSLLARGYLATQIELDKALEYLIAQLEEKNIADKTVIALSADHYPYGLPKKNYNELAGHKLEENFEIMKNSFLLWSGSMKEPIIVDKAGCSLDILPTLSNLLGIEYDSRLLMGTDLLSDSEPLVIFSNKSFITDKVKYNSKTGNIEWINGAIEDKDYLQRMNKIIKQKFDYSKKILDKNYYQYIQKNNP